MWGAAVPHTNRNSSWIQTPRPSSSFSRLGEGLQITTGACSPELMLQFTSAGFAVLPEKLEGMICVPVTGTAPTPTPTLGCFLGWLHTGRNIPDFSRAEDSLCSLRQVSKSLHTGIALYLWKDREEIVFWRVIWTSLGESSLSWGFRGEELERSTGPGFSHNYVDSLLKSEYIFSTFFSALGAVWIPCACKAQDIISLPE